MAIGTDCTNKKELYRAMFAEFLSTTLYVFFGCGTVLSSGQWNNVDGSFNNTSRLMPISMAFGIGAVVLLYCIAGISGGHMNPAVSLFLMSIKKITPGRAAMYMACQFAGGFMGAMATSETGVQPFISDNILLTHVDNALTSHQGDFAVIGNRTGTDKIYHHGYHRFYPPLLDRFRGVQGGGMLEIGVDESKSLWLWLEYFPRAFIYGIDIGVTKEGPRFKIMQADQNKTSELQRLARDEIKHPLFFIIDDGSHIPEHQVSTFDYLFLEVLLPGGTYIIEDIETSYWSKGGLYGYETRYGYHHKYSVLEVFKNVLDDIQSEFLRHAARKQQDRRLRNLLSLRTRQEINTVAFGQNCILITKKTAAEHEEFDGRRYRFSEQL